MSSLQKKNRRKGIIGTILFHTLLLVAFMFMGLTYQDPPPQEEGISINFGFINEGAGNIDPEDTEELTENKEVIEEQIENTDEVLTQSTVESTYLEESEENEKVTEKEKPEEKLIEERQPEINKRAIYTGKKKNKNKSEGTKKSEGNQGVVDGDKESDVYIGGGTGNDGTAYQLGTRKAIEKPKPKGNQVEGKVVVIITVNRLGDVTYAKAGAQGSTTFNKKLLERAKRAALKTKFATQKNAPKNQQGKIIYNFKLN